MAMGKAYRVLEKVKPPSPYSVLLEHRFRNESLLFESQAVAVLCEYFMRLFAKARTDIHPNQMPFP